MTTKKKKKKKKKTSRQGKNEHEKSTEAGSVKWSPIQALTGFALLNFTEKTRPSLHSTYIYIGPSSGRQLP